MCIITDTARKMNVPPETVFDLWACFDKDSTIEDVNKAVYDWHKRGKVSNSVVDFCLDILTDRIPLITLPRTKARNKLKGGED
jgi:hypothetical protein